MAIMFLTVGTLLFIVGIGVANMSMLLFTMSVISIFLSFCFCFYFYEGSLCLDWIPKALGYGGCVLETRLRWK